MKKYIKFISLQFYFSFSSILIIMLLITCKPAQIDPQLNENGFTAIPDVNFEKYLVDNNYDNDGQINGKISNKDALRITNIYIYSSFLNTSENDIKSVKGLEAFINLVNLEIYDLKLTNINLLNNKKLQSITIINSQISAIDLSRNIELLTLDCRNNSIKTLDLGNNAKLKEINCDNNLISRLNISKLSNLTILECSDNQLRDIDLSQNIFLEKINCGFNYLKTLNLEKNQYLNELNCSYNKLEALDIINNKKLYTLICNNNLMVKLDINSNTSLTKICCYNNLFNTIDLCNNEWIRLDAFNCNEPHNELIFKIKPNQIEEKIGTYFYNPVNQYDTIEFCK